MLSRRIFLLQLLFLLGACQTAETHKRGKLSLGVVSYGESDRSIEQYSPLVDYLSAQLKTLIELEPAFNEVKAIEQIRRRAWSLVFAPPGLAAIAISTAQYLPLFSLEGVNNSRSLILLRQDSPIKKLADLSGKVIALGQPGSATGYYLPLYNLYGLTLADVRFAPTPKTILEWIEKKQVTAGALSLAEFERYRSDFETKFRILHSDRVPPGAILVGPMVERNQQEQIRKALKSASPSMSVAAGYLPNAEIPDYKSFIKVVQRVNSIAKQIQKKPAPLH